MVEFTVMFDFCPVRKEVRRTDPQENATGGYPHSCFRAALSYHPSDGKINPIMAEARARGVIFDVGHGAGSFWFRQCSPRSPARLPSRSISTDLHTLNYTVLSMMQVMSKFLGWGAAGRDHPPLHGESST